MDGEVGLNQIQREIKGSLGQIVKEMKEVNQDGKAIKDSQIHISDENVEMINYSKQSVL